MILASPEVPSTVSLSSWRIMGRELIKSGISNGVYLERRWVPTADMPDLALLLSGLLALVLPKNP